MHTLCIPCWEGSWRPWIPRQTDAVAADVCLLPRNSEVFQCLLHWCSTSPRAKRLLNAGDYWGVPSAEDRFIYSMDFMILWCFKWLLGLPIIQCCCCCCCCCCWARTTLRRSSRGEVIWDNLAVSQYPEVSKKKISKFTWSRFCSFVYMFSYLISSIYQSIKLKHMSTVFLFHGMHAKTFSMFPRYPFWTWRCHSSSEAFRIFETRTQRIFLIIWFVQCGAPQWCLLVYNPHESSSYRYHEP